MGVMGQVVRSYTGSLGHASRYSAEVLVGNAGEATVLNEFCCYTFNELNRVVAYKHLLRVLLH